MPTYDRCPKTVDLLAFEIMLAHQAYEPVRAAKVSIDFLFARGTENAKGEIEPAIMHNGVQALGLCSITPIKGRAKGLSDVEILLDYDHWNRIEPEQQRALLDHELNHIVVVPGKHDDLGRPKIKMRPHDVEFGWFRSVAARNGQASVERIQAKSLMDEWGQYFWPTIAPESKIIETDLAGDLQRVNQKIQDLASKIKPEVLAEIRAGR